MERRDVPATWISTGDTSFTNPDNWDDGLVPGNWAEAIFDGEASTVDCTGVSGNLSLLILRDDYTGTVTFSGPVVTVEGGMENGAIAQPSAGYTLTINGSFLWTGGVINNTSTRSSIIADGYFEVYPSAGMAAGSDLIFQAEYYEETTAIFHAGALGMTNGAGIEVNAGCTAQLLGIEIECVAPIGGGDPGIYHVKAGKVYVQSTHNSKFTGKLFLNEGEVYVHDNRTFEVHAGDAKSNPAYLQTHPGGVDDPRTMIGNGSTLKAPNGVTIDGGEVGTTYNDVHTSKKSTIDTSTFSVFTSTTLVSIDSSPSTGIYCNLHVIWNVYWKSGMFMFDVDRDTPGLCARWTCTGEFKFSAGLVSMIINDHGTGNLAGSAWDAIESQNTQIVNDTVAWYDPPGLFELRAKPMNNKILQVFVPAVP